MQYREVVAGVCSATELAKCLECGRWPLPVEVVIDAKCVFDSTVVADARPPVEESLIAVLTGLREHISSSLINRIWWVGTEDMLADALTKGSVHREPLLQALAAGRWEVKKATNQSVLRKDAVPER